MSGQSTCQVSAQVRTGQSTGQSTGQITGQSTGQSTGQHCSLDTGEGIGRILREGRGCLSTRDAQAGMNSDQCLVK